METVRLRQFLILYQTGNMRKASELAGISHSGLSKSMSKLSEELGIDLYIQSGRGLTLTDEAHILAKKIPGLLELEEDLFSQKVDDERPFVRIGSFEVFTTYFAKVISPIFKDYKLDFHELVPGEMEHALIRREVDLAITYEPIPLPGVEHLKVREIEMGVYTKKGALENVPLEKLPFAAPLIPLTGSPTGTKGLDGWPDHKEKREIYFRVDLMETAISLARQGLAAVFIPCFVADLHNEITRPKFQLHERKLPSKMKRIKRSVYLVKRESTIEDKLIKKIASLIRKL